MNFSPEDAKSFADLHKYAEELKKRIKKAEKNYKHVPGSGEMHKLIPPGERPTARIDHHVAKGRDLLLVMENLKAAIHSAPDRACPPGTYTRLLTPDKDGRWEIMMTDAPYELRSSRPFIKNAHGNVLVAGLGIGATLPHVLKKRSVKTVTVIEKSQDVIDLVYPHLRHGLPMDHGLKLHVVVGNAFTWKPGRHMGVSPYDTIWLDIWPTVSSANLPEMRLLMKRFIQWLNPSNPKHWMGVWEMARCEKLLSEENKSLDRSLSAVGGDPRKDLVPKKVKVGKKTVWL